jgi:MinD superfamily P-loop ATPase
MKIAIASGKGGTGKTTVAVNLALSLKNVQLLDCDVEEPNAHIFLKPRIFKIKRATVLIPQVDHSKCTYCGRCQQVCAYHAIAVLPSSLKSKGQVLVFPNLCHSCGACCLLCPEQAIKEIPQEIGSIEQGQSKEIAFVQGRLDIGQMMSPPIIRQVKAYADPSKIVILDAPPGTSCPMITAVKGCDYCVLVTEPTPFGLNDLALAVDVLRKLAIPFGVVINRADLGDQAVEQYCVKENIAILMRLPFSQEIAVSYSEGVPIVEKDSSYQQQFVELFYEMKRLLNETNISHQRQGRHR